MRPPFRRRPSRSTTLTPSTLRPVRPRRRLPIYSHLAIEQARARVRDWMLETARQRTTLEPLDPNDDGYTWLERRLTQVDRPNTVAAQLAAQARAEGEPLAACVLIDLDAGHISIRALLGSIPVLR